VKLYLRQHPTLTLVVLLVTDVFCDPRAVVVSRVYLLMHSRNQVGWFHVRVTVLGLRLGQRS